MVQIVESARCLTGMAKEARGGDISTTDSVPVAKKMVVETAFIKPFAPYNVNEFVLQRLGNSTKVTWTMRGTNLYPMKVMGLFVNVDRLMGKHFEAGLESLKEATERDDRVTKDAPH